MALETYCLLPTAYCLLLTGYCLLATAHLRLSFTFAFAFTVCLPLRTWLGRRSLLAFLFCRPWGRTLGLGWRPLRLRLRLVLV